MMSVKIEYLGCDDAGASLGPNRGMPKIRECMVNV